MVSCLIHGTLSAQSRFFVDAERRDHGSAATILAVMTPSYEGLGFDSACPPGFRTQLHVTTLLSTGGGPVREVQLSEGGFQVVYAHGLWSRFSGVAKVLYGYG